MATKAGAKKSTTKKSRTKKAKSKKVSAKLRSGKTTASRGITSSKMAMAARRLAPMADETLVRAQMTSSQCIVWRQGEFRKRVREAVADWAQEPPASVLPTNTLGELAKGTPWNTGQQVRLVQRVNAHDVFAPPFPESSMMAPSQLLPASTTVAQWERVVWRHQNPETPCFPFTD